MAHILHILDYSAPGFGRPQAVARLCGDLAKDGHRVSLLIGQAAPLPQPANYEAKAFEVLEEASPGHPLRTHLPLRNNPSARFVSWVESELRSLDPDLVHVHDLAGLQAAQASPRLMCSIRSDISARIGQWLPLLRSCRVVECFNPSVLAQLEAEQLKGVSWNMSGVDDLAEVSPVKFQGDPRLLWMGRMDANRDPRAIIAALPALRDRFPGVRLSLLGDGPLREELQLLSVSLEVNNLIDWHGWVMRPLSLLAGADLCLFTGERMGFDRAPAEAMMLSAPLVVTPALAPIVKDRELGGVAEDSPESWERTIVKALEDPAALKTKAEIAQEYARLTYSRQACLERTLSSYEELLADFNRLA